MKILHIHSDKKFLNLSFYINPNIQNTIFFLGRPFESKYNIVFFPKNKNSYKEIAQLAEQYDIVVFMSMCLQHSVICNMLPSNVKVIWRFFGGELYRRIFRDVLTSKSLVFYRQNFFHQILSNIKNQFLYGNSADDLFWKAVNKCDRFLCLSDAEYNYLKCHFPQLPTCMITPYIDIKTDINYNKDPLIIVGHSGDIFGNHLDVIEMIKQSSQKDNYRFCSFLSYGVSNRRYYNEILKECDSIKTMELITTFLPLESFYKIEDSASALVINSIRQLAMGNIFSALRRGVKVYLNPANVMFKWFDEHGFRVFSVEELYKDIEINNIKLSSEEMKENNAAFNNLSKIYSKEDFYKQLQLLNN